MTAPDPRPLRVVHVTEADGAGVATYLRLLASTPLPGVRSSYVVPPGNELEPELRAAGHEVRLVELPRTSRRVGELLAVRRLRRALADLRPDIVHLHSSQAGLIGRLASWRRPWQVVYTPHAYYYLGKTGAARQVFLRAEQVLDRLTPSHVVATSPSEAARAVADVGVPARRVTAVLNGIEPSATTRCPQRTSSRFRVGLVARVSHQKNLEMFARLAAAAPGDLDLVLAGVGHRPDDHAALDVLLREHAIADGRVTLVPWMSREAALAWMEGCDAVVLTSRYESFGYTVAEAAMRGVPVVATDVDGVRDVVRDGVSGYLVPPDDDRAMLEHLLRLRDDAALYARMSTDAAHAARQSLTTSTWAAALLAVYRDVAPPPRSDATRGP